MPVWNLDPVSKTGPRRRLVIVACVNTEVISPYLCCLLPQMLMYSMTDFGNRMSELLTWWMHVSNGWRIFGRWRHCCHLALYPTRHRTSRVFSPLSRLFCKKIQRKFIAFRKPLHLSGTISLRYSIEIRVKIWTNTLSQCGLVTPSSIKHPG